MRRTSRIDPIDEYYYELNPIEKEIMYKYRCKKCGVEEWAPAFVVYEITYMDDILEEDGECKDVGMPIMICPSCNADFYYTGEVERI